MVMRNGEISILFRGVRWRIVPHSKYDEILLIEEGPYNTAKMTMKIFSAHLRRSTLSKPGVLAAVSVVSLTESEALSANRRNNAMRL